MGKVKIVSASAGSGKTYNMAYNYILALIDQPTRYRYMLAVTFTNKATDELKQRILLQLNTLANGKNDEFEKKLIDDLHLSSDTVRKRAAEARNYILHDYNNFSIQTIDKFFQRVMRAFIKELGIDLNFNLELHTDSLLGQAADRMLDELSGDEGLRRWVMDFVGENIEEGSGWNIKKSLTTLGKELFDEEYRSTAITTEHKPILLKVVSQANAIARREADKYQSLARQFVDVMDSAALTAQDFKQGSNSLAVYVQRVAGGNIIEPNAAASKALNDDSEWYTAKAPRRSDIISLMPTLQPLLTEIIRQSSVAIRSGHTAELLGAHFRDFALLADLRCRLDAICKEEGILPISDVNDLITKLVADNDAPFIYEKVGNRFTHFMIDEFQDTSRGQWNNFVPLLRNAVAQEEGAPVMLVGDVKQSIYRWRGGDWSLLANEVEQAFDEVAKAPLDENFRSAELVVDFNNKLIDYAVGAIKNQVASMLPTDTTLLSRPLAAKLNRMVDEAYRKYIQTAHDKSKGGYVTLLHYEPDQQVHPVIRRIEELQSRGFKAKDIAILVRSNEEAKSIATILLDHKAANPDSPYIFDLITQDALEIGSSAEVKFVVACLKLATNPTDSLSIATINSMFGRRFEEPIDADTEAFIGTLALLQPEEAFNEIMLRYKEMFAPLSIPYLQALHNTIIDFCKHKIADLSLWLEWWNDSGSTKSIALPQEADAITIATIHKSKGLAYTAVILPYCQWAMQTLTNSIFWARANKPLTDTIEKYPIEFNSKMATSEFSESYFYESTMAHIDALNTLYVAVTRAKQELHIMVNTAARSTSIGPIVLGATSALKHHTSEEMGGELYEYGSAAPYSPKDENSDKILSESRYDTYPPASKIAVNYDHQRYDADSKGAHLSPRAYGTLLHKLFEQAATADDVFSAMRQLQTDGVISNSEVAQLRQRVVDTLENNPEVAEWFEGEWDKVLNEREIISHGKSLRPDRVMLSGKRAVVVDYKFGLAERDEHIRQIREYAHLLTQMGYTEVKSYLWYISAGKVEEIDN